MYFEMSLQLYQFINTLNEPYKTFAVVSIYFLLPLLLYFLYWIKETTEGNGISY